MVARNRSALGTGDGSQVFTAHWARAAQVWRKQATPDGPAVAQIRWTRVDQTFKWTGLLCTKHRIDI